MKIYYQLLDQSYVHFFRTSNNLIKKKTIIFFFEIRNIYQASSGSFCSSITLTVSILSSDVRSIDASY